MNWRQKYQERLYTLRWHCQWLLQQHNGFVKKEKRKYFYCFLTRHCGLICPFLGLSSSEARTKFVAMLLHDIVPTMAGQCSNTRISWWYPRDTFEYLYFSIKINLKNVFVSQFWNTFTVYRIYIEIPPQVWVSRYIYLCGAEDVRTFFYLVGAIPPAFLYPLCFKSFRFLMWTVVLAWNAGRVADEAAEWVDNCHHMAHVCSGPSWFGESHKEKRGVLEHKVTKIKEVSQYLYMYVLSVFRNTFFFFFCACKSILSIPLRQT